jgi:hypothetical protein
MAAQFRRLEGNDNEMPGARPDGVPACRASIWLDGAIRLHDADLDFDPEIGIDGPLGRHSRAQSTSANVTTKVAATSR